MTSTPAELPRDPDLVPGMPYRHYKGGAYAVVGVGRFEADLSPVVVYEAMRDRSLLWVRAAEVFSEPVATPQGTVPRFAPDWPAALACLDFLPRKAVLDVLALYDAPYRRYHDRRHVLEMFEQARIRGLALNPAQALAALFHDAVYVPGCEHNEAASAALIGTMRRAWMPLPCNAPRRSCWIRARMRPRSRRRAPCSISTCIGWPSHRRTSTPTVWKSLQRTVPCWQPAPGFRARR